MAEGRGASIRLSWHTTGAAVQPQINLQEGFPCNNLGNYANFAGICINDAARTLFFTFILFLLFFS